MGHLPDEEIERRFTYHPPTDPAIRELHDQWRENEKWMARAINNLPGHNSREVSLAFTKLEEMAMQVHAHIARNLHQTPSPESG